MFNDSLLQIFLANTVVIHIINKIDISYVLYEMEFNHERTVASSTAARFSVQIRGLMVSGPLARENQVISG